MKNEKHREHQIQCLIESTREACKRIADSHNNVELSNITDRIKKTISADDKDAENSIKQFLLKNENYFNYFSQLLESVMDIYGIEISNYSFNYSVNVNGTAESNGESEVISILEAESVSVMDELLKSDSYKDLSVRLNEKGSFEERIKEIIQCAEDVDAKIIKSFYTELCIQLQNFFSAFIGKTFRKKITNSKTESKEQSAGAGEEIPEASGFAAEKAENVPQYGDENESEYKNISVNCSDSGLDSILKSMNELKMHVSKLNEDEEFEKLVRDFNLMDILSKDENSNDYIIKDQKKFETYYVNDKKNSIRRKPGLRGVIPKIRAVDPQAGIEKVRVIYDQENDLPELKKEKLVKCPVENYPKCINKERAVNIIEDVYHFTYDEDSSTEGNPVWHGTEIANAVIMFENGEGWSYQIGGESVKEFDVAEHYKDQPSTSTGVGKAFMNGHHGIPSEWAESKDHCQGFYDANEAPVIMLRDTIDGSTHRFITTLQNMWDKCNDMKTSAWNYSKIRKVAMEQLYIAAEIWESEVKELEKWLDSYSVSEPDDLDFIKVAVKQKTKADKQSGVEKLHLSSADLSKKKEMYIGKIKAYFEAADNYYKGIYEKMFYSGDSDIQAKAEDVFKGRFGELPEKQENAKQ